MSGMAPHDLIDGSSGTRLQPGRGKAARGSSERRTILTQAVLDEVIPHLATLQATPAIRAQDVAHFTTLVLQNRTEEARQEVARLHRSGVSVESLALDLLTPAARLFGEWWIDDTCSFIDVTAGVAFMHDVLRDLSSESGGMSAGTYANRRILLTTVAEEQHSFGVAMLAEFFRRADWEARSLPRLTSDAATALLRSEWFDIVGLSVGAEIRFGPVAELIRAIRAHSRNPDIRILVGGPAFQANPGAMAGLGADGTASNAREAVRQAENLRINR